MTDRDEERYRLENDITTTSATATSPHLGSVFDTPNNAPTSSTFGTSPQTENNKVRAREAQLRLKQELVDEKQRLLKIKAEKLNQIETLQTRVEQLSKVQKETNIKNQLNELLEKSQVEFYKRLQSRNQQQQDYMLQHLNVLPSADWDQRLSLAKKFIPFLDIDKLKTYNEYFDDKLIRVFEFTILSPLVLNLRLKLDINTSDDSVFQISVVTNLTTLHMLSSSFARALVDDYTPNGKINCIMYGLNSLTRLIQKRTKIWHQLVIKYKSLIQNDRLANISAQVSDYTKLYAHLKSLECLELMVNNYKLSLDWSIVNNDHLTGSCQSKLQLCVTRDGIATLKDAGSLFTSLIPKYGVVNSLEIILCNIFNYKNQCT